MEMPSPTGFISELRYSKKLFLTQLYFLYLILFPLLPPFPSQYNCYHKSPGAGRLSIRTTTTSIPFHAPSHCTSVALSLCLVIQCILFVSSSDAVDEENGSGDGNSESEHCNARMSCEEGSTRLQMHFHPPPPLLCKLFIHCFDRTIETISKVLIPSQTSTTERNNIAFCSIFSSQHDSPLFHSSQLTSNVVIIFSIPTSHVLSPVAQLPTSLCR